MYGTSASFKELIRKDHKVIAKAEVWDGDNRLAELQILSGSVDDDIRRTVRRTCQLELFSPAPDTVTTPVYGTYTDLASNYATYSALASAHASYGSIRVVISSTTTTIDNGIVPDDAFDILAPFGNELRLWRGIEVQVPNPSTYGELGTTYATYADLAALVDSYGVISQTNEYAVQDELVPLGVFVITSVDIEEIEGGVKITVEGQDRSLRISRNRWTDTYTVAAGTNVVTAIQQLLENRWDDVQTSFASTTETTTKAVFGTQTDNDPWKDAQKIAKSNGLNLFFDGDGICRLEPTPTYQEASPVESYEENEEAMVLNVKRSLSVEQTFSGVIALGSNSDGDTVARAEVWDDDPESPTYRYGKFGSVPRFFESPLIHTNQTAKKVAAALLEKSKGAQESISWSQITDPSLESGDLIKLKNTATKVNNRIIIDRLTIPLAAQTPMSCIARTIKTMQDDEVVGDAVA